MFEDLIIKKNISETINNFAANIWNGNLLLLIFQINLSKNELKSFKNDY